MIVLSFFRRYCIGVATSLPHIRYFTSSRKRSRVVVFVRILFQSPTANNCMLWVGPLVKQKRSPAPRTAISHVGTPFLASVLRWPNRSRDPIFGVRVAAAGISRSLTPRLLLSPNQSVHYSYKH